MSRDSDDSLIEELEWAIELAGGEENEGRAIREVLYALDRKFGAEAVLDQLNHVAEHDSDFSEALKERRKEHRNGRLG